MRARFENERADLDACDFELTATFEKNCNFEKTYWLGRPQ
jgi:hypothetical protein